MTIKQETIDDIITSENNLVLNGWERYGEFYKHALDFGQFLDESIESINSDITIFVMFLSQIKKHYYLAFFSTLRLHHIQAMMNLRQVLEAASCAAYAIANTDVESFAEVDNFGILDASKSLTRKRYEWLQTHYSDGSDAVKRMKDLINNSTAHSNIIYAQKNFKWDENRKNFYTPFFDLEDDYHVKSDLWMMANIVLGITDLFYGINLDYKAITFNQDFIIELKKLEVVNQKLKKEMMSDKRFTAASTLGI